jgi:N6-L-threonylcarbamoyladenine synthase
LESLPLEEQQQSPSGNEEPSAVRRRLPDFISATRGPGMRSNLSVGLDTAKGLSVAWQIPLVGVHHMQAHLLTPRLVSAMEGGDDTSPTTTQPEFPFISMLISGGHSIIANSKSLLDHDILATTVDIGMGTALDKAARPILSQSMLESTTGTMYGKLLEQFAFPNGPSDYADYQPPKTRGEETEQRENKWGWSITSPFANTRELKLSFSNVESTVTRILAAKKESGVEISDDEKIDLAREVMRVCFEHLASRMIIALEGLKGQPHVPSRQQKYLTIKERLYRSSKRHDKIRTLVLSGGVAANGFLMKVLRSFLDARGFKHIQIISPPPVLCTDNAAMIGWAGLEMYEAGWRTDLSAKAIRNWTLDSQEPDGGILGPGGWINKDAAT